MGNAIIFSLYKHWAEMILSGEKPIEFRSKLPKGLVPETKLFFYETARNNGARAIVGEGVVDFIIDVLHSGKWPMTGEYPFIDYYYENIVKDKETADLYRKMKAEFSPEAYPEYRYGFILNYVFSEDELTSLRTTGKLYDYWARIDEMQTEKGRKHQADIDKGIGNVIACSNWLEKIGFYNWDDETDYKYGIVLKEVKRYDSPKLISDFVDKNGNQIKRAPQSFMYCLERSDNH